jgi:hypothetical protein
MIDCTQHCLSREKQSEKVIRFAAREGVFWLPDAEILVLWKGNCVWMPAKQVGDGVWISLVYTRPVIETINWQRVVYGLSLYQEYDEDSDLWQTYLRKYPWGEAWMIAMNAMSKQFDLGISVGKEGKFVALMWGIVAKRQWEFLSIDQAFGVLVWISLGYGAPKNKTDHMIMSWQVNLPCLGEIMRHESLITHVLEVCSAHWIFVIHSEVKQRDLTVRNWTIHDPEVLALLRAIRTQTRPVSVLDLWTERLVHEYLEQNGVKWDYVLKFVRK